MNNTIKGKACMIKWILRSVMFLVLYLSFFSVGHCADTYYYTSDEGHPYIKATGTGYYRLRGKADEPRQKLMARRAAVVDSYRKLLKNYGRFRKKVHGRNYREKVSGYISGVEVRETRYFSNGKVEVDTVLPINESGTDGEIVEDELIVCRVVPAGRAISREEYEDLFRK